VNVSNDVRDDYAWFLADPVFSTHLGDKEALAAKGYVAESADRYWKRATPHEVVIVDRDSMYMVGEEGIKDLIRQHNEVQEQFAAAGDELDRHEEAAERLTALRRNLTAMREASQRKRELTEEYERVDPGEDFDESIRLASEINERNEEIAERARRIESLLSSTSDGDLRRFFEPSELETIAETVDNFVDDHDL